MKTILVTVSRTWPNDGSVQATLKRIVAENCVGAGTVMFRHGGCVPGDSFVHDLCERNALLEVGPPGSELGPR